MKRCRECKIGTLKITGTGYYDDTIMVECQNPECQATYELEPDGLGEGGMEWVVAKMMDEKCPPEILDE